jgi:hypothetical protein
MSMARTHEKVTPLTLTPFNVQNLQLGFWAVTLMVLIQAENHMSDKTIQRCPYA